MVFYSILIITDISEVRVHLPHVISVSKMMSAARSAGMRYKKRNSNSSAPKKKGRSGSIASTSQDSSTPSLISANSSTSLLTVPTQSLMRKRSGSVPAFKVVTLAGMWNLRYEQVRALRMTWARLCEPPRSNCKGIVNLVERVWEKLDNKDPSVRNIFYNAAFVETMHERCERRRSKGSIATLRDHTHFFVSLVSQVIQSLDVDPESIIDHIDTIGRNHAYLKQYGFRSVLWEKVGEYFIDIVVIQDCVRGFPEACRAWTILIAALVDRLRAAPRRGSFALSAASSQNSINGSTHSINSMRRGSTISSCNGSQTSVNESAVNINATFPKRKTGCRAPSADLGGGCISMASLEKALPDIRASNPAIA
ncbi:hypothetical protein Y032_0469g2025 [Ancylostoma ceylanicum]|uniref:Globin family profile domain-containing protein n=3 Tax=Ancylostoma ceylanicum TaxID=53326 RepID=A0A016WYU9_9BILA|nr:hypothetical protein Y032_0469g2025 [Ancylostoma ceylanicum]